MKKLLILAVWAVSLPVFGWETKPMSGPESTEFYLHAFLTTDTQLASTTEFDSFLKRLEEKKSAFKKEKDFVRYIFSKAHQSFLKKYEVHASFSELFENGSYNCLTGTILYATILNHFQIPFEVIETNYHIFLTVETGQGKVLLEATDPLDGFVSTPHGIEKRINTYKQNTITASNNKATYYHFSFDLFKSVSMEELRGLLYYNKAVDSFNQQNLEASAQFLLMAKELYHSPRIDEFSAVLLQAVKLSAKSDEVKEELLKSVYAISRNNTPVASLQGN